MYDYVEIKALENLTLGKVPNICGKAKEQIPRT